MSGETMDDLQQLWRDTHRMSEREVNLITRLIREKGNAFPEVIELRNRAAIILGLTIAFFLLLTARTARWPWVGPGFALIGISALAGAIIVWISNLRHGVPDSSLELRLYCAQLLRYYDIQMKLARVLSFVCTPLFGAGLALIGLGFWKHSGSVMVGILCGLAVVGTLLGTRMRSRDQLQNERNRIELLLEEIGAARR